MNTLDWIKEIQNLEKKLRIAEDHFKIIKNSDDLNVQGLRRVAEFALERLEETQD